jgi:ribosomal protein S18 acetylase RimI-like enzyme
VNLELGEDEQGAKLFLVATVDGEPVGRATLDFTAQRASGGTLFRSAWVEPEWRSRGIGAALVRRAEEIAEERGYEALDLLVRTDNPRALSLYRRLGFEVVGEEVNRYVADGGEAIEEDCWSLRKRLAR